MIKVLDLWTRLNQYSAKYQSGAVVVDTFNAALAETQAEIYNDLSDFYQTNEKVRGLLGPWVKKINQLIINGILDMTSAIDEDDEFDRIVAMGVTDGAILSVSLYEINPITEGELVYTSRIPQRKPDQTKKRIYFMMDGATIINLFPVIASIPCLIYYIVFPTEAKIAFTYTETDDEDVMTYSPTDSIDLAWTKDAENIIIYKMLQKYGITSRDNWVAEYSKIGIDTSIFMQQGDKS